MDDPRIVALNSIAGSPDKDAATPALSGPNRSDLEALKIGAAMMLQAGNRVAALVLLWSAVAIDPTDLAAHRRLAATLAHGGDIDGAANEYARYIECMLPLDEVGRATLELEYGAKALGGHAALHEAAEKIVAAIRAIVPSAAAIVGSLPAPRLLPKVPFRFCVHDEGELHWMQLEGGTTQLVPVAVRLIDVNENVIETRQCLALAPGQRGHARIVDDAPPSLVWVVVGISNHMATAIDSGEPSLYRIQAKVGDEWLATDLVDTGCRLGRPRAKSAVSVS